MIHVRRVVAARALCFGPLALFPLVAMPVLLEPHSDTAGVATRRAQGRPQRRTGPAGGPYRLANCGAFRASFTPFLRRSLIPGSRVSRPACLRGRRYASLAD